MGRRFALAAGLVIAGCATAEPAPEPAAASRQAEPAPRRPRRPSGYQVRQADEARDPDAMAVRLEHGFLVQEDAEEAIRTRWSQLTGCYQEAGAAREFAGGPVKLRFMVDASGRSGDVLVLQSRLGSFPVERCLIGVGRTIVFPRPEGGSTNFDYTMEFRSTGRTPVMELSPDEVLPLLPALLPKLAAECQQLGAEALDVTLYIGSHGAVKSLGFAAAAALDPASAQCLSDAIHHWVLPLESVQGRALGRVTIALRNEDLLAAAQQQPTHRTGAHRSSRSRR
jgi:hypothetical protein